MCNRSAGVLAGWPGVVSTPVLGMFAIGVETTPIQPA